MIILNLEDTIEPLWVSEDLTKYIFNSELKNDSVTELHVHINIHSDPLLPNVYNLAFGPLGDDGEINDSVKLNHSNINKVFSTIILFALAFLQENNQMAIGIDGSNEVRAYLYHRMFKSNHKELSEFLITIGVDWYVKLLRTGEVETDNNGFAFFKPRPEPFDTLRKTNDLYRYYLMSLNQ
jgi:hypothetical protein